LATRLLAGRVREIYLGAPEAKAQLRPGPRTAIEVTGSPIRPPEPERRESALVRFGLSRDQPVLLVTGGSQGSVAINELIHAWVAAGGARNLSLLWSAGRGSADRFRPTASPPAVQVFDFIDPIADAYAVADLVVCRSGMMTLAEVCAWGLPAILIPLPSAAADHQRKNAEAMVAAGAAVMLAQRGLTSEALGAEIGRLAGSPEQRRALGGHARARGRPGAVAQIVSRLEALIRP
jgi:UDP-N-acetylglucosamine--N-acetylmuramyl-(pentapeptide) pyrophosphoryl-undecaprenol N-acetylglucosamine transferase